MIEADYVVHSAVEPQIIDTPSQSGTGQKIARCAQCRTAVWSNYAGAGPVLRFVRVGTPDLGGETRSAAPTFAAVAILTTLAVKRFDPRLMGDTGRAER